jgi:UDP:flavonoid glycosyltransferase YjiC (YdhE family)
MLKLLEEKNKELFDWMNLAHQNNIPIVYVSIGTECRWKEWSVKAIYEGLKKVGCKVIWSLKDPFKIPEENENFWVSSWIP